jgi:periplasmic protein TonB
VSESNHAAANETNISSPQEKTEAFPLPPGNDPQPASPRQQAPGLRLPPRYWLNPPPPYPSLALKRQWQGEVRLRVLIDEQGQVIEAQVENSSGYKVLDQSALEAVHAWKFHPAQQGNEKIRQEASIPIRFELK